MSSSLTRRQFLGLAPVLALGVRSGQRVATEQHVEVEVLGTAQDAGMPHFACQDHLCGRARSEPDLRARVSALGLRAGTRLFLIDATPDINDQVARLQQGARRDRARPVDGVLLTHAHIGHYLGLAFLGKESVATQRLPVYCTPRMGSYLGANGPWSLLVSAGHIDLVRVTPGAPFPLALGVNVTAIAVPHREEFTDTVGYLLSGPERRLLYIPDIDRWELLEPPLAQLAELADILLLDGSFYDPSRELPGRDPTQIPHPPIPETMSRLEQMASRKTIRFIHLNHSNPVWDPTSAERDAILSRGFGVASEGDRFPL